MAEFEWTGTFRIIIDADSEEEARQQAEAQLDKAVWEYDFDQE
jgi:hypothetical protein